MISCPVVAELFIPNRKQNREQLGTGGVLGGPNTHYYKIHLVSLQMFGFEFSFGSLSP